METPCRTSVSSGTCTKNSSCCVKIENGFIDFNIVTSVQEGCVLSPFLFLLAMDHDHDCHDENDDMPTHWYPVEEQIPAYRPWICRRHCVTIRSRSWSATHDHKPWTRSCNKILQQDRKLKETDTECRTGWTYPAPAHWRAFVAQCAQQRKKN